MMFQGQFAPVKGNYSQELKDLIMDMLKQDPDQRPSASEILYTRIPEVCFKKYFSTRQFAANFTINVF